MITFKQTYNSALSSVSRAAVLQVFRLDPNLLMSGGFDKSDCSAVCRRWVADVSDCTAVCRWRQQQIASLVAPAATQLDLGCCCPEKEEEIKSFGL